VGSHPTGTPTADKAGKIGDFRPVPRYVLATVQYRDMVTMECSQRVACDLSHGTIPNDLE